MKKTLSIIVLAGCVALGSNVAAGSKPANATAKNETKVELGTDVKNQIFKGTVKEVAEGTALVTAKTTYLLIGGDFQSVIGKRVNLIGKVVKDAQVEKIVVAGVQIAQ